jgi:hypothetical protein
VRLFLIAALACFVIALLDLVTNLAWATWPDWLMGGLISYVLDALLGGYHFTVPRA